MVPHFHEWTRYKLPKEYDIDRPESEMTYRYSNNRVQVDYAAYDIEILEKLVTYRKSFTRQLYNLFY